LGLAAVEPETGEAAEVEIVLARNKVDIEVVGVRVIATGDEVVVVEVEVIREVAEAESAALVVDVADGEALSTTRTKVDLRQHPLRPFQLCLAATHDRPDLIPLALNPCLIQKVFIRRTAS
jgi:hypothetical protein